MGLGSDWPTACGWAGGPARSQVRPGQASSTSQGKLARWHAGCWLLAAGRWAELEGLRGEGPTTHPNCACELRQCCTTVSSTQSPPFLPRWAAGQRPRH